MFKKLAFMLFAAATVSSAAHAGVLLDLAGDSQAAASYSVDFTATQSNTTIWFAGATVPGFIDVTALSVVDLTTSSSNLFASPTVVSAGPWVLTPASSGSDYYYIGDGIAFGSVNYIPDVLSQTIGTTAGNTYDITFNAVGNTGQSIYSENFYSNLQVGSDTGQRGNVPEPGTLALLAIAGLALARRRKSI